VESDNEQSDNVAECSDTVAEYSDEVAEHSDTVADNSDEVAVYSDTIADNSDEVAEYSDTVADNSDNVAGRGDLATMSLSIATLVAEANSMSDIVAVCELASAVLHGRHGRLADCTDHGHFWHGTE
jgi:methyl-accepting chemotaxis protein